MRKILRVSALAAALALLLTGCATAATGEKPVVAVSIIPEETFVKAVCGDFCEIVTMIPPGASPETYEPSPKEKTQLENAQVYFAIGVPSEENSILTGITGSTRLVHLDEIVRSQYADLMLGAERDPHIWLSPKRVKVMVAAIRDEMSALYPEMAETFRQNAETFLTALSAADEKVKSALSGVEHRAFIVFHPAFGYFADEYGLTMYALEEEGKEATAKGLMEMVDFAKENGIKVIFYQAEMDSRQSRAFAEEIGGEAMKLNPLSADYLENLESMATVMAEAMQ